jgi:hypothetical protein
MIKLLIQNHLPIEFLKSLSCVHHKPLNIMHLIKIIFMTPKINQY